MVFDALGRRLRALIVGVIALGAIAGFPLEARAENGSDPALEWREVFNEDGSITRVQVPAQEPTPPVASSVVTAMLVPIQVTGPSSDRLDLVFVGDGYTADELDTYGQDVLGKWQELSNVEPFLTYRGYFNVWRVDVVSRESGVDNDPTLGVDRDTALDMRFWCANIERLLCVNEPKALAYAANAPEADQVIALANSTKYGGAGGTVATSSGGNAQAGQIVVHELGHSLGGLADEYEVPFETYTGPEPVEPNVSIFTAEILRAEQRKWFRWLGEPSPDGGIVWSYEGARFYRFGLYRPTENSIMRTLGREFNLPGREAMIEAFYRDVRILRTSADDRHFLSARDVVAITTPELVGSELDIRWYVDAHREVVRLRGHRVVSVSWLPSRPSSFTLTVRVVDDTPYVRDEAFRAAEMVESRSWSVRLRR